MHTSPTRSLSTLCGPLVGDMNEPASAAFYGRPRGRSGCYENEIADLKTKVNKLERDVAAEHGEIHRLRNTGGGAACQRR